MANRFLVSANQHFRLKFLNHSNRKHSKVCEVASLKIVFGRGKCFGRKVWKGQVYGKPAFAEISARLVSYKQKPNLRFNVAFRACGGLYTKC
ncbi:hypothetical protein CGK39_24155 [Vibrio parahaemolyticus]|nr:hypothetical protein D5E79_25655 [Vibrio parahaemolyticus]TNZ79437.1 hypothetical protein CGK39_24155 [Vibrio parahaemolyticus]TOZ88741.1 hypothetical protein DXE04_24955 [Vibrio parahaemolyticus]TPA02860.1 hypothetical protein DXE03_25265 [Vibrio parahaemolyticus]